MIADATGNEALSLLVRTLVVLSGPGLEQAAATDGVASRLGRENRRAHGGLLAAVIEDDALAARAEMATHLVNLERLTPGVEVPIYFAGLEQRCGGHDGSVPFTW